MLHWPLWVVSMGWSVAGISLQRVELNHSDGGEAMSMGDTKLLQMPRSFLSMPRPSRWAIYLFAARRPRPGRTDSVLFTLFFFTKNLPGAAHPYICLPPTRHEVQAAVCPASTRICPPPRCICPPSARHRQVSACHLPATCLPHWWLRATPPTTILPAMPNGGQGGFWGGAAGWVYNHEVEEHVFLH